MMLEKTLTIQHEMGLHARPAALFVQMANQFAADIEVLCGNARANAKSILNVLTLGANKGAVITICADGPDAENALVALSDLVESNFNGA
jgi:phosphotransferase system HPr (HPr) family protein